MQNNIFCKKKMSKHEWSSEERCRQLKVIEDDCDLFIRLDHTICTLEIKAVQLDKHNIARQHILIFSMYFKPFNIEEVNIVKGLFKTQVKNISIEGHKISFFKNEGDEFCSYDESNHEFNIVAKIINNNSSEFSAPDQTVRFDFLKANEVKIRVKSPTHSALSNSSSTNSLDEIFRNFPQN